MSLFQKTTFARRTINMKFILKIYIIFNFPRFLLHGIWLKTHPESGRDLPRWLLILRPLCQEVGFFGFVDILLFFPEYRNLFYARVKENNRYIPHLLSLFAKPLPLLNVSTHCVGKGLHIQHGFATIIAAHSIGENCWINQGVSIGYSNKTDCPTIGDNVTFGAGVKVIGSCKVGNNVIIGANAVVVKDIPDNCVVVGVPAYIIRRNGKKVREKL